MHERDARPGVGEDPQDWINQQLGDQYEILIGIFWARFGTRTLRAESGSAEEFERAYARYKANSQSVSIMVYFKDTPIAPSAIDPAQLRKVQKFQKTIGRRQGVLWKPFNGSDELSGMLRLHLSLEVREWSRRLAQVGEC